MTGPRYTGPRVRAPGCGGALWLPVRHAGRAWEVLLDGSLGCDWPPYPLRPWVWPSHPGCDPWVVLDPRADATEAAPAAEVGGAGLVWAIHAAIRRANGEHDRRRWRTERDAAAAHLDDRPY